MKLKPMYQQVLLLSAAQAIFQTVSVLVMTVGALAASTLTKRPDLFTLPIGTMFLGTAVGTFPASMWMTRAGRRSGFVLGALAGALGGLVAACGAWTGSLWLLATGTFFVGIYQAFAQFYRFAAGEVSDDLFRPRAISFVLAGGIAAALSGPLIGQWGADMFTKPYVGSFLLLSVISLLGAGLLLALRRPPSVPFVTPLQTQNVKQPLGLGFFRRPAYLIALIGAATGYGVMILAMTSTPLAMSHHHHDLSSAATVIQLHVLGMFVPSFFTGTLIARFGVTRIMFAGVVILAGHVMMTLTGTGFTSFAAALILLGIGWNFLYIGGTTLLTSTYNDAERGRAQAINDMAIFATGLGCSLGAASLLQVFGWQMLNVLLLPWLGFAAAALIWLEMRR